MIGILHETQLNLEKTCTVNNMCIHLKLTFQYLLGQFLYQPRRIQA